MQLTNELVNSSAVENRVLQSLLLGGLHLVGKSHPQQMYLAHSVRTLDIFLIKCFFYDLGVYMFKSLYA